MSDYLFLVVGGWAILPDLYFHFLQRQPNIEVLNISIAFYTAMIAFFVPFARKIVSDNIARYNSIYLETLEFKPVLDRTRNYAFLTLIALILTVYFRVFNDDWSLVGNIVWVWVLLIVLMLNFGWLFRELFYLLGEVGNEDQISNNLYVKLNNGHNEMEVSSALSDLVSTATIQQKNDFVKKEIEKIFDWRRQKTETWDEYTISYRDKLLLNKIQNIFKTAVDSNNEDVCWNIMINIDKAIKSAIQLRDIEDLKYMLELAENLLKLAYSAHPIIQHKLAFQWLPMLVLSNIFNAEDDTWKNAGEYLAIIEKSFVVRMFNVIDNEKFDIFRGYVSQLYDDSRIGGELFGGEVRAQMMSLKSTLKYQLPNSEFEKSWSKILSMRFYTNEQYLEWWKHVSLFAERYQSANNPPNLTALSDSSLTLLRQRRIAILANMIASYCLMKKKYNYVQYLWEYLQPNDAHGKWIGNQVFSITIEELLIQYLHSELSDHMLDYNMIDGHHSLTPYCRQYFVLQLSRILLFRDEMANNNLTEIFRSIDTTRLSIQNQKTNLLSQISNIGSSTWISSLINPLNRNIKEFFDTVVASEINEMARIEEIEFLSRDTPLIEL